MIKLLSVLILIAYSPGLTAQQPASKKLIFLNFYQTSSDTTGTTIVSQFRRFNLTQRLDTNTLSYTVSGKEVFSGKLKNRTYLIEVFNDSHLLISYLNGQSIAAGPELFERDFTTVVDLATGATGTINLGNVRLTRSPEVLAQYHQCIDSLSYKTAPYTYATIDTIDVKNHEFWIITQCHEKRKVEIDNP